MESVVDNDDSDVDMESTVENVVDVGMEDVDLDIDEMEFGAGIKETFGEVLDPPDVGCTLIFAQQWPSLAFAADALSLYQIFGHA